MMPTFQLRQTDIEKTETERERGRQTDIETDIQTDYQWHGVPDPNFTVG